MASDPVDKGKRETRHGGARKGAGRPRKFQFADMIYVGQACDALQREATAAEAATRHSALPYAAEIRAFQGSAQSIPVEQRKRWLRSDDYEDHRLDLESWLHARAGTPLNEGASDYERKAPRGQSVANTPPRGTRKRIIAEIAARFGLTEGQTDNLWQQYRRHERRLARDLARDAET